MYFPALHWMETKNKLILMKNKKKINDDDCNQFLASCNHNEKYGI